MKKVWLIIAVISFLAACNHKQKATSENEVDILSPVNKGTVDSANAIINRWTDSANAKMDSARELLESKQEAPKLPVRNKY